MSKDSDAKPVELPLEAAIYLTLLSHPIAVGAAMAFPISIATFFVNAVTGVRVAPTTTIGWGFRILASWFAVTMLLYMERGKPL